MYFVCVFEQLAESIVNRQVPNYLDCFMGYIISKTCHVVLFIDLYLYKGFTFHTAYQANMNLSSLKHVFCSLFAIWAGFWEDSLSLFYMTSAGSAERLGMVLSLIRLVVHTINHTMKTQDRKSVV